MKRPASAAMSNEGKDFTLLFAFMFQAGPGKKKRGRKCNGPITDAADMYENPVWHKGANGWAIKYREGAHAKKSQAMSVFWWQTSAVHF